MFQAHGLGEGHSQSGFTNPGNILQQDMASSQYSQHNLANLRFLAEDYVFYFPNNIESSAIVHVVIPLSSEVNLIIVYAIHYGQGLYPIAFVSQLVAASLESLLYGNGDALNMGAGLEGDI